MQTGDAQDVHQSRRCESVTQVEGKLVGVGDQQRADHRRVAAEVAIDQSPGTLTLHQQEPGESPAFRRARRLRARA